MQYFALGTLALVLGCALAFACYHRGEQAGAKIALAVNGNPAAAYRQTEIRGECASLFHADECAKCHTIIGKE